MQTHEQSKNVPEQASEVPGRASNVKHFIISSFRDVTPARLALLLFLNFALACLFCLAAVATIRQHNGAVKTLGIDAAPSVVAAYKIKGAVAAMDVDLSSQLLSKTNAQEGADVLADFETRRVEVGKNIIANARNITYAREQTPVENIQVSFGRFLVQAQKCRDDLSSGNSKAVIADYKEATQLKNELLRNADELEKVNSDVLEKTYAEEKSATNLARGLVYVLGTMLICMLAYTQIFLTNKFHRRLCPPLLLAVAALAFSLNHVTASLADNSKALVIAKEDSYDSALFLLTARASVYNACAAACRVLLDRENAAQHEKEFQRQLDLIAKFQQPYSLQDTIAHAKSELAKDKKPIFPGAAGLLINELANVRFPGEAKGALDALQEFGNYCQANQKMFDLEKVGKHDDAVSLCLSFSPSGCKHPLDALDEALLRTIEINTDQMDLAIKRAFNDLRNLEIEVELVSLFAVICAYFGLMPRMEEYVHCQGQHKE